ncbi:cytochrome P450 78A5-like [Durio zibethinus]|uniref:Cytochrome P450 78A5-like n=1 Tax=Durio zibethinus TaxID=66656 RepID=A0A6P6BFF2_DURZI|nr:cytochrome P450 78A5-like [Durio zibethinus]
MKFLMLTINLSLLLFCYVVTTHQTPWPLTLLMFSFLSVSPFFLNYWLVPGGFAWRNHHVYSPQLRGPVGWPLLGTLPLMGSHAHRKLANMAASLGASRLMAFSIGTTRVIISSHPDTAREILSGSSFSDRPIKESARLLMFERAIGFAPSDKYWHHLRRIAANHMFSPRRISCLESLRQQVADEMVVEVRKGMEENGLVELREILQKGSLSNILQSVFGSSGCFERKELGLMVKEGYELISLFNWEDYFPLRFLDFHGMKRRCHKLSGKVRSVVGRIVKERKKGGDLVNGGNDFLTALLALPKEDQLSDSDMVAVLWEMIFRGTDTVAILLEWIMARMVLHQDIQAKVQQEIDACIGNRCGHVQYFDIPNLPYLQAVVKEVLRMHPPGPLLSWARLATHDVDVGKCFIPAGTTAMVNMWAITHDPSIWKDPWRFRPERFVEEEDVSIMGSDLRLAPFGSGRRVCPGKALALATVQLWLARLLHSFRWLPGAQNVDLLETLRLSLEMKKPLVCQVIPRTAQHVP